MPKKIGDYSLLAQAISRQPGIAPYGMRYLEEGQTLSDATPKGKGYFGEIPVKKGGIMGEMSSAYEQDGKLVSHPLIVPTLTKEEIDLLGMGLKPTPEIYKKAQDYAQQRIAAGQSPFASPQELRYPMPSE